MSEIKISSVRTTLVPVNHRGAWVFVEIETDAGITGLGEASHSRDDGALITLVENLAGLLAGQDPTQLTAIVSGLGRENAGHLYNTALSAIEQALWDVKGQLLGVPIADLLGGSVHPNRKIPLYANINRGVTDRSPAGFARAAYAAVDAGFGAVKLAPFDEVKGVRRVRTGAGAAWRAGVARVAAVREAVGDNIEVAVDCHSRFDVGEAINVAAAMADLDLMWFEEAVDVSQRRNLQTITRRVSMPTASCESLYGAAAFRPFFEDHIVDVVMPDVKHDGGLMETFVVGEMARGTNVRVSPHNPAGPVATLASGQVMLASRAAGLLEFPFGEVDWRAQVLVPPEPVIDGHLVMNEAPGLGHALNHEFITSQR